MAISGEYQAQREASCPIDGCQYTDSPESVEAHISGSTTGGHKGRQGREFREVIGSGLVGAVGPPVADGDLEDDEDGEPLSDASPAEAREETAPDTSDGGAMLADVDPATALVVVTVVVIGVAVVRATWGNGSDDGDDGDDGQEDDLRNDFEEISGGLIEA